MRKKHTLLTVPLFVYLLHILCTRRFFFVFVYVIFKPLCQKMFLWTCAPREDSDQTAHSRSLIRIFTGRILDIQEYTDWSFRQVHISEGAFSHVVAHFPFSKTHTVVCALITEKRAQRFQIIKQLACTIQCVIIHLLDNMFILQM